MLKIPNFLGPLVISATVQDFSLKPAHNSARLIRTIFLFNLFIVVCLFFGGKFILVILFGNDFLESYTPLVYLLPALLFIGPGGIIHAYFMGRAYPIQLVWITIITGIMNIVLNIIYIPKFGILAAAAVTSISLFLWFLSLLILFYRESKISYKEILLFNKSDIVYLIDSFSRVKSKIIIIMKVLVLSTMYPNSVMYLSGIFVHEQVKALSKVGVEVKVIAPVPHSPFPLKHFSKTWSLYSKIPQFEIIDDINVYHSRYLAIPRGILKDYWHLFYKFSVLHHFNKTNDLKYFDIIYCHGTLPNDYAAFLLSRKFDKPFVITVHGETVYQIIHQKRKFQKSKIAIENASAVIGDLLKLLKE